MIYLTLIHPEVWPPISILFPFKIIHYGPLKPLEKYEEGENKLSGEAKINVEKDPLYMHERDFSFQNIS